MITDMVYLFKHNVVNKSLVLNGLDYNLQQTLDLYNAHNEASWTLSFSNKS